MALGLRIPRHLFEEMLAHARKELPHECCGLLSGDPATGEVTRLHRLVNSAASPSRYFAEEKSLLAAFRAMRDEGTELLAIYHSHPDSAPAPSRTDLADNFYGEEVVHFIISLKGKEPFVQGWHLAETGFRAADWECLG